MSDAKQDWLKKRRIGSSDAPILFGCGYSGSSLTGLWRQKVYGERMSYDASLIELMRDGKEAEPFVIESFASRNHGWKVRRNGDFEIRFNPRYPFASCTLDADAQNDLEKIVIEAKWITQGAQEWYEKAPLRVAVQVIHQLMCCPEMSRGVIVARVNGRYMQEWVERDEELIARMLPTYEAFWHCVETKTPPDDDSPYAYQELRIETVAATARMVGDELSETARELKALQREADRLEQRKSRLQSVLAKAAMGVEYLRFQDGTAAKMGKTTIQWKTKLPTNVKIV